MFQVFHNKSPCFFPTCTYHNFRVWSEFRAIIVNEIRFQLTSHLAFQNTYYSEKKQLICIPGTWLSSIFGIQPSKRRPVYQSKQRSFGFQAYIYILQRPTPLTKAAFQRLRNKKHPPKIWFPLKSCALSAFAFWFFSCSFSSRSLRSFNLTSWRHCCFWQNKLGEIEKTKKNKPQFIALYTRWNPRPWWLL